MKAHRTSCGMRAINHAWVGESHDKDVKQNLERASKLYFPASGDLVSDKMMVDREVAKLDLECKEWAKFNTEPAQLLPLAAQTTIGVDMTPEQQAREQEQAQNAGGFKLPPMSGTGPMTVGPGNNFAAQAGTLVGGQMGVAMLGGALDMINDLCKHALQPIPESDPSAPSIS